MLALYIIAGIVLLVILLFSIPVDLAFDIVTYQKGGGRLRMGWLFGLVGKELLPGKKRRLQKVKKARKVERAKKKPDLALLIPVLRTRGLVDGVARLVRRMLRSLRVRELDASLRLGLPDPADTGLMYGFCWPAFAFRGSSSAVRFRMEPAFEGPVFEASLQGAVRVFPAQVAANAVRFVVSPPGLRVIRLMVVSRWKKRK
ncbi:MAG: DUF2953 domain-containing protein [Dehalococcoidales bacterium]|nr:DUF2953 domain-containing protein [Dehalococcoidales bacterium]